MKYNHFYEDLYDKLYKVGYHDSNICHTVGLFKYIGLALEQKVLISTAYSIKYSKKCPKLLSRNIFNFINYFKAILQSKKKSEHIKILDVGCSHGLAVKILREYGFDAYGIDVAPTAIDLCTKRYNLKTCKLGSATAIPFQDNFFDVIISSDTIEHILPVDVNLMANEFYRVTKKSCLLAIAQDPESNKTHLNMAKEKYESLQNVETLHTCLKTTDEWNSLFKKAGFQRIQKISDENFLYQFILRK
jgi:ubiquinone/menaquinone biosynthesis C-methylase UbiE